MKAILLAAGRGTRISRMVEAIPKSTLPIAGTPLIRYTVDLLARKGIESVVCVGYRSELIKKALDGKDVTYCENPFYEVTNSIASLWFAQCQLDDDIIIMNADVYLTEDILDMVLNRDDEAVMAIDFTRTEVGDYFFKTTESGSIIKYGKELPLEERTCEYVGIAKISKSFIPVFIERMNQMIWSQQYDRWWENVLYSFTDNNEREIKTVDVDGKFWSEIDYFDDYERILNHINSQQ